MNAKKLGKNASEHMYVFPPVEFNYLNELKICIHVAFSNGNNACQIIWYQKIFKGAL